MASEDFNGSTIVILTKEEAWTIYNRLIHILGSGQPLTDNEQNVIHKIARDLNIREGKEMKVNPDFKSRSGTWRLSNEQMTIKVEVDSDNNIRSVASVAYRFVGQPFNNLAQWMNNMGKTDIVLLSKENE